MNVIFYIAIIFLSADIILASTTATFINKINIKSITKLITLPLTAICFLGLGLFIGRKASLLIHNYQYWYTATILFMLSIKLIYSQIKLQKLKQSININNNQGLIIFMFTILANNILCGIAFGIVNINYKLFSHTIVISIMAMLIGIALGLKAKKLTSFKYDLLSAIAFLSLSIIVLTNFN